MLKCKSIIFLTLFEILNEHLEKNGKGRNKFQKKKNLSPASLEQVR